MKIKGKGKETNEENNSNSGKPSNVTYYGNKFWQARGKYCIDALKLNNNFYFLYNFIGNFKQYKKLKDYNIFYLLAL
jgi:hypothetical protein